MRRPPVRDSSPDIAQVRARFEENDIEGTLELATAILSQRPADLEAAFYVKTCRARMAARRLTTQTPAYEFSPTNPPFGAPSADPSLTEMRAKFVKRDHEAALSLAHAILRQRPADLEATVCAEECRTALEEFAIFSTGSLHRVAVVKVSAGDLLRLDLDHRSGFLLSLIDGLGTIEVLLDVCAMPRKDALRALFALVQDGVVAFK